MTFWLFIVDGPEEIHLVGLKNQTTSRQYEDSYRLNITEGEILAPVRCEATCHPNCTYGWKKDGTDLNTTDGVLELEAVNKSSAGLYTCVASRTNGNYQSLELQVAVLCKQFI